MKKFLFPLFVLLALSFVLVSCEAEAEEPKYYTVTFKDGDNVIKEVSVKEGDKVAQIQDPEKEGYVLLHWNLVGGGIADAFDFANTPINSDITLSAVWEFRYTVTFDSDDNYEPQRVKPGEKATKPGPSTVTWGYYVTSGGKQTVEVFNFNKNTIEDDITLFKCYKVEYKNKGGMNTAFFDYVKSGEKTIEPSAKNIINTGYSFKGWYKDSETTIPFDFANTLITQDTVIYSKWEADV